MNYKERMERLKENDPIMYYELTSDPTGASGDDGCIVPIFTIILTIVVTLILIIWD